MHEIVAERLWIGTTGEAHDLSDLLEREIAALVDLAAEELSPKLTREIIYCRFPLVDGPGNSRGLICCAVETVAGLLRKEIPTLVSCSAGMSRSPCVVAAAMAGLQKEDPDEHLRRVTAQHPHDITPALWEEIKQACSGLDLPSQA